MGRWMVGNTTFDTSRDSSDYFLKTHCSASTWSEHESQSPGWVDRQSCTLSVSQSFSPRSRQSLPTGSLGFSSFAKRVCICVLFQCRCESGRSPRPKRERGFGRLLQSSSHRLWRVFKKRKLLSQMQGC